MTAAVWALLRSNGLARTRWAVAFGVFVALMALARTMAVAYIPGLALAALALILAREGDVRLRIRNLALAGAAAALVAGPWYVRNFSSVYDYLLNTGYGSEAVAYGHRYPFASSGRWSKELRLDLSYLSLPIAGALALCFGAGLALAVARPGRVRRLRTTSVPGLGSVVVTDGRGAMQQVLARNGYDIGPITHPLPSMHRRWLPLARDVVGWLLRRSDARREPLHLTLGLDDHIFSNTRLLLAAQLWFRRYVPVDYLRPFPDGDTVTAYRHQLTAPRRENALISGEERPSATTTRARSRRRHGRSDSSG